MLRALKTLLAVAREGTFSAAGDKIGLTQAAVSAQMQRLESELGLSLFDRDGRSARLNKTGEQVRAQAETLIHLYDKLGATPTDLPVNRLVRVGAIASAQGSLLPDALARFFLQFPDCKTKVIPGLSIALFNLVDSGDLDLAVIVRPPFALHRDLRWRTLASEPFRLIVPRDLPGTDWVDLLSSHPFVRYDRSSFGGRLVDRFLRDMRIAVREVAEVDELEAIVKLVALGVGVALIPQTAHHRRWPPGVRAVDLGHHRFCREIGLIDRAGTDLNEPASVLATLIAQRGAAP